MLVDLGRGQMPTDRGRSFFRRFPMRVTASEYFVIYLAPSLSHPARILPSAIKREIALIGDTLYTAARIVDTGRESGEPLSFRRHCWISCDPARHRRPRPWPDPIARQGAFCAQGQHCGAGEIASDVTPHIRMTAARRRPRGARRLSCSLGVNCNLKMRVA